MVDLSQYVLVARYNLPEPSRANAPANNVLAQEASAVTYNWDTDTLFITGDGGLSITEVTKTGQLVSTMTLAQGNSPQGTEFYDPEGLTYVGNGVFVMTEERDRQIVQFTYKADTTLIRADTQTVDLGTFSPNQGLEGITYDPLTGGFILAKEVSPQGLFQTNVDFTKGSATNGSATTENSVNLFDPALLGVLDLADVYALSNLPALTGTAEGQRLLVLSQESAKILEVDRSGTIFSSLQIVPQPGDALNAAGTQHEGLTMDRNGFLYVVDENGSKGDISDPELWVYAPSTAINTAPTAITLKNTVTTLPENTGTGVHVRVGDVFVTDDGLGTNTFSLGGADAASFEVDATGLYIKQGVTLDFETQSKYSVTVNVDDKGVGATPDASTTYSLTLADVVNENATAPGLIVSEVSPWSSGNSPVMADWFEVTNTSGTAINIAGWKFDDSSRAFGSAVALNGVTSIAPGELVIFLESDNLPAVRQAFIDTWFGGKAPVGLQIGNYTGGGVGLSTGGDEVNIYDATGALKASVTFGLSPLAAPFTTFENAAGVNNGTVTTAAKVGVFGGFVAANDATEIGSPGTAGKVFVSEVAPFGSSSPVGADWFEVTNTTAFAVDMNGWKMDDNSESPTGAVAMTGISAIAPGESVIYLETADLAGTSQKFIDTWFGGKAPTGLKFGAYNGSGVGLSAATDAVNLYDANNVLRASVNFGASVSSSFDNAAGTNKATITTISAVGLGGAFKAAADATEVGSPGTIGKLVISEVAAFSSSTAVNADWFEVTNQTSAAIDITGWKMDDSSAAFATAVALSGITTIKPGESVIFLETDNLAATRQAFINTWFGGNAPAGLQIGAYSGGGVGLSTSGDGVVLFDAAGAVQASVTFGASPTSPLATFDNAGGQATVTALSAAGVQGGFVARADPTEIGSPGLVTAPPPPPFLNNQLTGDYNGDHRDDILWRNADGTVGNWLGQANGGFVANNSQAIRVGTEWLVAGAGDFNGDGRDDIVWRRTDGTFGTWLGQANGGFTVRDGNALLSIGNDWKIAGTADINGDGRDDILWRQTDGTFGTWLGQANGGFTVRDGNALLSIGNEWKIAGTGDFNGDGRDDILWRHTDGRIGDWLGQPSGGFTIRDGNVLVAVGNDWKIVGTGDFNGDGRDDILWRHTDGRVGDWLGQVNGGFVANDGAIAQMSLDWQIAGTGDFNGDGHEDILLRNTSTGGLSDWLGQANGGFASNDANALSTVALAWQVQLQTGVVG